MFKIDNTPLKIFVPFFTVFVSLSFADIITTKIALFFGGVEANSFINILIGNFNFDGAAFIKICLSFVLVASTIIYMKYIEKRHTKQFSIYRKVALVVWLYHVGSLAFVIINNILVVAGVF